MGRKSKFWDIISGKRQTSIFPEQLAFEEKINQVQGFESSRAGQNCQQVKDKGGFPTL